MLKQYTYFPSRELSCASVFISMYLYSLPFSHIPACRGRSVDVLRLKAGPPEAAPLRDRARRTGDRTPAS